MTVSDPREAIGRIMQPNPQPWTVASILDHGFGEVLFFDGFCAWMRVCGFHLVEGAARPDTADILLPRLAYPALVTSGSADWNAQLKARHDLSVEPLARSAYVWSGDPHALAPFLARAPDGYEVRRIGAAEAAQIVALDWADDVFDAYRNVDDYLSRGFGFCVVHGDEVVSLCTLFATSTQAAEIEVDTAPTHRGRGLAKVASAHFMAECVRRNLAPVWDASNAASEKVAEALGFRLVRRYESLALSPRA
ncbi:MAG TPA: GNAT family N-acetyltransferase [Propylenella sp.]|nr:GNAT family N-acetyltransferase [Propylenella sp.]